MLNIYDFKLKRPAPSWWGGWCNHTHTHSLTQKGWKKPMEKSLTPWLALCLQSSTDSLAGARGGAVNLRTESLCWGLSRGQGQREFNRRDHCRRSGGAEEVRRRSELRLLVSRLQKKKISHISEIGSLYFLPSVNPAELDSACGVVWLGRERL